MPTEPRSPMFKTMTDLKLVQRLDDLPAGSTAERVVGQAVDDARSLFYTHLGLTKTVELTTLAEAPDPPTTEDHHRWLLARSTEQRIVRRTLLTWLTTMVKDGGNAALLKEWNQVGAFRDMSPRDVSNEVERLNSEIASAFEILSGSVAAGSAGGIQALVVGSKLKDKYRVPGYSIHAGYLYCFALDSSNE